MKLLRLSLSIVLFALNFFSIMAMEGDVAVEKDTNYLAKISANSYYSYLQMPDEDKLFPVLWTLSTINSNITINNIKGIEEKKSKKAVACAMQHVFLQLENNIFDLRYLEKALLGKRDCAYQPTPEGKNYVKSTLRINEEFSQEIIIPQDRIVVDQQVVLRVISFILPKLSPVDQKEYKFILHELARGIMSPVPDKETGDRCIFFHHFQPIIRNFADKIGVCKKNKIDTVKKITENHEPIVVSEQENLQINQIKSKRSITKSILWGLSLGLNVGFAAKYFLKDYLQDNPKYTLSLLGVSSFLGGLGGCVTSKLLK